VESASSFFMGKRTALFIQNGESDNAGLIAAVLASRQTELAVIHAWNGEKLPQQLDDWAGLIIGGGSMSVYEKEAYPFLQDEENLILAARRQERPILGICLGAQLMASAFGGKVFHQGYNEIGFFEVQLTEAAKDDVLWRGAATSFHPAHWHRDTFSLPADAVQLASSHLTVNQAFRVENRYYGLQFHLEMDEPTFGSAMETDHQWLADHGVSAELLLAESKVALPTIRPLAEQIFERWNELLPCT
jgi:GMP synthase (glutamine-hydrolysing)